MAQRSWAVEQTVPDDGDSSSDEDVEIVDVDDDWHDMEEVPGRGLRRTMPGGSVGWCQCPYGRGGGRTYYRSWYEKVLAQDREKELKRAYEALLKGATFDIFAPGSGGSVCRSTILAMGKRNGWGVVPETPSPPSTPIHRPERVPKRSSGPLKHERKKRARVPTQTPASSDLIDLLIQADNQAHE